MREDGGKFFQLADYERPYLVGFFVIKKDVFIKLLRFFSLVYL